MSITRKPLAKVGDIETYTNKDGTGAQLQACQATGLCGGCVHHYENDSVPCLQMSHCADIIWKEVV